MKKFINDFKAFIRKGNVVDLAVAVIIGGAFGKIVTSLVNDMIMPFIVLATGKHSLSELIWVLRAAELNANGEVVRTALTVNWGGFLQTIIDFLVIALVVFIFVRLLMKVKTTGDMLTKHTKQYVKNSRKALKQALKAKDTAAAEETLSVEQQPAGQITEQAATEPAAATEQAASSATASSSEIIADTAATAGDLNRIEKLLTEIRDSLAKKD